MQRLTKIGVIERLPVKRKNGWGTSTTRITDLIFQVPETPVDAEPAPKPKKPPSEPADPTPEDDGAEVIPLPGLELTPEEPEPERTIDDGFEELWQQSPRRRGIRSGRKKAKEKYVRLINSGTVTHTELLLAITKYAAFCDQTQTFAKDLSTWLHGECWSDEIEPANGTAPRATETAHERRSRKNDEAMREWLEMNNLNEEPTPGAAMLPNTHSN